MKQPSLTTDPTARAILIAMLRYIVAIKGWPSVSFREYGIPYAAGDWRGDDSPAVRQRASRAVAKLDAAGLLVRFSNGVGNRTTHLRPTAALLAVAADLAGDELDLGRILENLRRTVWGSKVADEFEATKSTRSRTPPTAPPSRPLCSGRCHAAPTAARLGCWPIGPRRAATAARLQQSTFWPLAPDYR